MDTPKRKGSGKRVFVGFLLGLAVGAATALLLAPDSGEKLRAALARRGMDVREQGTSSYITLSKQLQERYSEALAESRAAYERAKQELSARYNRAKGGML